MPCHPIILFDGDCLLCNRAVQFILANEHHHDLRFASLQSNYGQKLLNQYHFPNNYRESMVFIEDEKAYTKSSALLKIAKYLNWKWQWLRIFMIIPSPVRNTFYSFIAKKRLDWFGKQEHCMLLTKELRERFLDVSEK